MTPGDRWDEETVLVFKKRLYAACFRNWLSVLEQLDKMAKERVQENEPISSIALLTWKESGEYIGLNEESAAIALSHERDRLRHLTVRQPKSSGCWWFSCACEGHKPYDSVKACKGCGIAVYCGIKCQTRYIYPLCVYS